MTSSYSSYQSPNEVKSGGTVFPKDNFISIGDKGLNLNGTEGAASAESSSLKLCRVASEEDEVNSKSLFLRFSVQMKTCSIKKLSAFSAFSV